MSRSYPILSEPGTWAFTLEMVCRDSRQAMFTEDSAVYTFPVFEPPTELLLNASRQWECCNAGRRWVAAIDTERIVVVQHVDQHAEWEDVQTYRWTVEFYCDEGSFEDRLDQLANVQVVA